MTMVQQHLGALTIRICKRTLHLLEAGYRSQIWSEWWKEALLDTSGKILFEHWQQTTA